MNLRGRWRQKKPLRFTGHLMRWMPWQTKRACLRQGGRHGPTPKVGIWLPHALCGMHPCTPVLMNVHAHIHVHIIHIHIIHVDTKIFLSTALSSSLIVVFVPAQLDTLQVTSYILELPTKGMTLPLVELFFYWETVGVLFYICSRCWR